MVAAGGSSKDEAIALVSPGQAYAATAPCAKSRATISNRAITCPYFGFIRSGVYRDDLQKHSHWENSQPLLDINASWKFKLNALIGREATQAVGAGGQRPGAVGVVGPSRGGFCGVTHLLYDSIGCFFSQADQGLHAFIHHQFFV